MHTFYCKFMTYCRHRLVLPVSTQTLLKLRVLLTQINVACAPETMAHDESVQQPQDTSTANWCVKHHSNNQKPPMAWSQWTSAPEFCRTCNHSNIHCSVAMHWLTDGPPFICHIISFPWLFFKFCISMLHDAQDGARGSVEAFHQKSERWMWFSLVQELWVQQLLYGIITIILPGLNKLPATACQCHYLNMCQHCENTPFFWSWPISLPETLSMLQAYSCKLQGVNRGFIFVKRVSVGRPSMWVYFIRML